MKVLLVHNEYRELGGEEKVVEAEHRLLREHGVEVQEVRFRSAELEGLLSKLRTAWELPHSDGAKQRVATAIRDFQPDVMHVHNFFPLATPSIFEAAQEADVPAVMTLHNYRILCANGLLLRDGKPCELCLTGSSAPAVTNRCYQGSLLGSAALARMISTHREKGTWQKLVNRFIVLTEFAKSRYVQAGLPPEKFAIKPNFIFDPGEPSAATGKKVLFVGRLSQEKGLDTLLRARALRGDYELHIVGDGPLAGVVQDAAAKDSGIHWHGRQGTESVYRLMRESALVVFPSECYENFPIVLLEAMAHARPALAARIGGLPEIMVEGSTGALYSPGNAEELQQQIEKLLLNPKLSEMGLAARARYLEKYTPELNFHRLTEIYQEAIRETR